MEEVNREIAALIQQKIEEGVFGSAEHALEVFKQWLEQIEQEQILERMRNEDA